MGVGREAEAVLGEVSRQLGGVDSRARDKKIAVAGNPWVSEGRIAKGGVWGEAVAPPEIPDQRIQDR